MQLHFSSINSANASGLAVTLSKFVIFSSLSSPVPLQAAQGVNVPFTQVLDVPVQLQYLQIIFYPPNTLINKARGISSIRNNISVTTAPNSADTIKLIVVISNRLFLMCLLLKTELPH